MQTDNNLVSIIIPLFNQEPFTRLCLEFLLINTPRNLFELILVDNGSKDETSIYLQEIENTIPCKVIRNSENLGFAKACNQGASAAQGKSLLFLNNDTVVHLGWLEALLKVAQTQEKIGVLGSKLLHPDHKIQHAGVVFDVDGLPNHIYHRCENNLPAANKQRDFAAITGACLMVSKEIFSKVGGFSEKYLNGFEDIDFCLKVREAGYRVVYCPESVVTHFESRTYGRMRTQNQNLEIFQNAWRDKIKADLFIYLNLDGMALVRFSGHVLFVTQKEIEPYIQAAIQEGQALANKNMMQDAALIFGKKIKEFPFNNKLLQVFSKHCMVMGQSAAAESLQLQAKRFEQRILPEYT